MLLQHNQAKDYYSQVCIEHTPEKMELLYIPITLESITYQFERCTQCGIVLAKIIEKDDQTNV